jgi:inorganic pyrophosphatase
VIFEVFVEAAKGSRIDDKSHSVAIGRRFPSGARYPADYGFMPWTLADDQNPLDVVLVAEEPSFPGRQVWCRAIAILWVTDHKGRPDAKILAAPVGGIDWHDIHDVPESLKIEIKRFFESYKRQEPGAKSQTTNWDSREAAEREIGESLHRWNQQRPKERSGPSA